MAFSLFSPLANALGDALGDPVLTRWYRNRLWQAVRRQRWTPPVVLPPYLNSEIALEGNPIDEAPAVRLLWMGNQAALDRPLPGGALAQAGLILLRQGMAQHQPAWQKRGLLALTAEAQRLQGASGMWLEDSLTRHLDRIDCYAEAWRLTATTGGPDHAALTTTLRRMLAALPPLRLPGGVPAIGDVPAEFDAARWRPWAESGDAVAAIAANWTDSDRAALQAAQAVAHLDDLRLLQQDGWLRLDIGRWSTLYHHPTRGWLAEDGFGHHDIGSFEVHFDGEPILVDGGSPSDWTDRDALGRARSAALHNSVSLDGANPTPIDNFHYEPGFRHEIAGPAPALTAMFDGATVSHDGFRRLGGIKQVERRWQFDSDGITVADRLHGTGRRQMVRRLVTPLPVVFDGETAILQARNTRFRLVTDGLVTADCRSGWHWDGRPRPLTIIAITDQVNLPWFGAFRLIRDQDPS